MLDGQTRGKQPTRPHTTILIVDADRSLLRLMTQMLTDYRVLVADDGRDALGLALTFEEEIAVLLAEVDLPEMGGTELARWFQETRPETKVVLMSARRPSADGAGGDWEFMRKPFSPEELLQKVHTVLQSS